MPAFHFERAYRAVGGDNCVQFYFPLGVRLPGDDRVRGNDAVGKKSRLYALAQAHGARPLLNGRRRWRPWNSHFRITVEGNLNQSVARVVANALTRSCIRRLPSLVARAVNSRGNGRRLKYIQTQKVVARRGIAMG